VQLVWFAQAGRWKSGAPVPLVGAFIAALIALAFGTATLALWVLIVSFLVLNVTVLIAQTVCCVTSRSSHRTTLHSPALDPAQNSVMRYLTVRGTPHRSASQSRRSVAVAIAARGGRLGALQPGSRRSSDDQAARAAKPLGA
jgi:hypothetical protein